MKFYKAENGLNLPVSMQKNILNPPNSVQPNIEKRGFNPPKTSQPTPNPQQPQNPQK